MGPRELTLVLPRFLERALAGGHPWVYRDHVPRDFTAEPGATVRVRSGGWSGFALWDASSPIALRITSTREPPSPEWVGARVRAAWELREPIRQSRTTAYRWIFGEGDQLPGIVVDLYAGWAVMVTYADGLERVAGWVAEALGRTTELRGILQRASRGDGVELVRGREPPRDLVVEEHGVRLRADLREGQKTGLFLDHRENRCWVGARAGGRSVLNLFSYTGGFSLHAALGGATRVSSVDSAPAAIDAARENFRLNGLDPEAHDFVALDAFEYLEQARAARQSWDLVISDPPSFAHKKEQARQALRAYQRLNAAAIRVTAPGGLLVAASCTSQVGPDAFRQALAEAAARAGRRLQIVHDVGQPVDHPVMAQHLEGRYLKLIAGRVVDPA